MAAVLPHDNKPIPIKQVHLETLRRLSYGINHSVFESIAEVSRIERSSLIHVAHPFSPGDSGSPGASSEILSGQLGQLNHLILSWLN